MSYPGLSKFVFRMTKIAISKLEDADASEAMRIAENVSRWASDGSITSAQLEELAELLPDDAQPDIPEEQEPVGDSAEDETVEEPQEEPAPAQDEGLA